VTIFGDLRGTKRVFVAWYPSHSQSQVKGSRIARLAQQFLPHHELTTFIAQWEDPSKAVAGLRELGYAFEHHNAGDPLRAAADVTARNWRCKTVVNVSLALRTALRCYLGLQPKEIRNAANL
jgi:hypothetical protein